jgi:hypothetical protein
MGRIVRSSFLGVVIVSTIALSACADRQIGTPSTDSAFSTARPLLKYSFKVQNDTNDAVTLSSQHLVCMKTALNASLTPHQTKEVEVETVLGPNCNEAKRSYFTTTFSTKRPDDDVAYIFIKRTLKPWEIEHDKNGRRNTLGVLMNGTDVRIYTVRV